MDVVVLISGRGSNLKAIYLAIKEQGLPINIKAVISNKAKAEGLQWAHKHNLTTHVVSPKQYANRALYEDELKRVIDQYNISWIVLAGFMRILGADFIQYYANRIINIHPSLLPAYTGLNTHARVLANQDEIHGASVHLVNEEVDAGAVLAQVKVGVSEQDDCDSLANKVLHKEHVLYPQVLAWLAAGQLIVDQSYISFNGQPLKQPIILAE